MISSRFWYAPLAITAAHDFLFDGSYLRPEMAPTSASPANGGIGSRAMSFDPIQLCGTRPERGLALVFNDCSRARL
jgi:hypothetical protein